MEGETPQKPRNNQNLKLQIDLYELFLLIAVNSTLIKLDIIF